MSKKKKKKTSKKEDNKAKKEQRKRGGGVLKKAALIPLQPAMVALLKAKNLPTSSDPEKNAITIYERIIRKRNNYEYAEPVLTTAIITAVISFFRDLAKRKREGKIKEGDPLYKVAEQAEAAETAIIEEGKSVVHETIGSNFLKFLPLIAIGIAVLFLSKK